MSTMLGPLAELERDLGLIVARNDLNPAEKLAKLRALQAEFQSLLDLAGQYIGDTELLREAEASDLSEALFRVRENASIRAELLARGMADPEDLDELGYLSFAELDRLQEEGRLLEWASVLQEANLVFDPRLHPRDRLGKFRDILGGLSPGKGVSLPHGVNVSKQDDGKFVVKHKGLPGGQVISPTARGAAERALTHFDQEHAPKAPGIPKVDVKGRHGKAVPGHIHGPSASQIEQDAQLQGADPNEFVNVGGDIELAAKLIAEGRKVELDQPREVSTLLDKLSAIANEAKEKGEKAPDYDLCNVTVKGTNLFCVESKGIPRVEMPQLVGDAEPGSKADALPRNARGEIDITDQFREHLKEMGVEITPGHEAASYLRASQAELNGVKTAGIMGAIEDGVVIEGSLFVSRDNYIVDGHHRWAAEVGRDLRDNQAGDVTMQVERIDMDIGTLLDEANNFAREWGIQQQGVGEAAGIAGQEQAKLGAPEAGAPDTGAPEAGQPGAGKAGTPTTPLGTPWEPQLDEPIPPDVFNDGERASVTLGQEPSDEEVQAALAKAQEIGLNKWPKPGALAQMILGDSKDTQQKFTSGSSTTVGRTADGAPDYIAERKILHDRIADILLRRRRKVTDAKGRERYVLDPNGPYLKPPADGQPIVVFMGGGTASGKTTALNLPENADEIPEDAIIIDPDEIKAMLPEYQDMVIGGEKYAASGIHEESSDIAARMRYEAKVRGLHVVLDGTGDTPVKENDENKVLKRMRGFAGEDDTNDEGGPAYRVRAFYVSADTDVAVIRATRRAMGSGRWVPEPEIRKIHSGVSQRFQADMMQAIEEGVLTGLKGYDSTNLDSPQRMFHLDNEGKFIVVKQDLYDKFIAKKDEYQPDAKQ